MPLCQTGGEGAVGRRSGRRRAAPLPAGEAKQRM